MPELPEVETTVRGLARFLEGEIIARITLNRPNLRRPFPPDLVQMMTGGPVVIIVLEGENAIARNRELMGATDPAKADKGTIRKDFAKSIGENTVHGSDSKENAATEINYFFSATELS